MNEKHFIKSGLQQNNQESEMYDDDKKKSKLIDILTRNDEMIEILTSH